MDPSLALSVPPRSDHMQAAIAEFQRIEHWRTESNTLVDEDVPNRPPDKPPKPSIKKKLKSILTRKKPKTNDVVEVETRVEEDDTSEYEDLTALPPMPTNLVAAAVVEGEGEEKKRPRKLVKKRKVVVREEERRKAVERGVAMSLGNGSSFSFGEREKGGKAEGGVEQGVLMSRGGKSMVFFREEEVEVEGDEEGGETRTETLGTEKSIRL